MIINKECQVLIPEVKCLKIPEGFKVNLKMVNKNIEMSISSIDEDLQ